MKVRLESDVKMEVKMNAVGLSLNIQTDILNAVKLPQRR